MAVPVIMPRQGQSVESCIISKWNKKKGDRVEIGDILFSYETDKASFDEEAKAAGTILDIFFEEGDDVPCLTNVCVIGNPGEDASVFNPNKAESGTAPGGVAAGANAVVGANAAAGASAPTGAGMAAAGGTVSGNAAVSGINLQQNQQKTTQTQINNAEPINQFTAPAEDALVKISPRAKKLAEKAGVDYRYATPTGPYGRIIERDIASLRDSGIMFTSSAMAEQLKGPAVAPVPGTGLGGRITTSDLAAGVPAAGAVGLNRAAAAVSGNAINTAFAAHGAAGAAEPAYEEVKLPNIRRVIARTMHQSISSMAQLTLNSSFDATEILEFRKKLKEGRERLGLGNITINDIIIYAVSRTLKNHRDLNAHFLEDRMLYFKSVNIGVAVDTERGLMVPTLFNADRMSLDEISAEVKKLAKDCQSGTINPDLLKNGTFTITNLGTLDIESFTPVINPPQTGILGVNNIMQRARKVDGNIEFYPAMGLSLTFDHRALDGAPAARFLKELKTNLESFGLLLAKG